MLDKFQKLSLDQECQNLPDGRKGCVVRFLVTGCCFTVQPLQSVTVGS